MPTVTHTVLDGEIVEENRGGVITDYVADPLGSTVALLDGSQTKSDTFNYWPYGEVQARSGSTPTAFQFVGTLGYYRDSSARTYVRARYYRQSLGRWQTVDPLWPVEARYTYAHDGPPNFIDFSGLKPWDWERCLKLIADIRRKADLLAKEWAKYNPWTDLLGGCKYGRAQVTKPYGHFKEIIDLQRGILNDYFDFYNHCRPPRPPMGPNPELAPLPDLLPDPANIPEDWWRFPRRLPFDRLRYPFPDLHRVPVTNSPACQPCMDVDWGIVGGLLLVGGLAIVTILQPETAPATLPAIGKLLGGTS